MPILTFVIPDSYTKNERLDKYVASLPESLNRSHLKSSALKITLNQKEVKLSRKVRAGDKIEIVWEDSFVQDIKAQDIPLDILYEDDSVCVVNKKQGMVTHPACGNWEGTLVNALLFHWGRETILQNKMPESEEDFTKLRPGIVHRLDKDTSGVIITAKNRKAEEWLQGQFKNHSSIQKEYLAICIGRPPKHHDKIRTHIVRDNKDRKRFKATEDSSEGKFAETHYVCIACYGNYSLMRVRILTGRTHQIRVHMKYIHCPILGDSIYGTECKEFKNATLMLHASKLKIRLPFQSELSEFSAPLPNRFKIVMKKLHSKYAKYIIPKK